MTKYVCRKVSGVRKRRKKGLWIRMGFKDNVLMTVPNSEHREKRKKHEEVMD